MSSFSHGLGNHHLIDVNQNVGLLTSSYRPTGNEHAVELQEQIKAYRRDLARKDDLIARLSNKSPQLDATNLLDTAISRTSPHDQRSRTMLYNFDPTHTDLAATRSKIDNISSENRDLQLKLNLKDNHIQELRSKMQLMKEDSVRQAILIQTLKEQIQQAEQQSGSLEEITNKGTVTIHTLQRENREAQEKMIDLESRLRSHALVKEETEQEVESFKRKFHDAVSHFGDALNIDTEGGHMEGAVEVVVEKAKTLSEENFLLQSKVQTLEESLDANSLEAKTNRETISRLVSEVGKEQKSVSEASNNMDRLKRERDDAIFVKESLERELELLKERLITNDKTWFSSREELTQTVTKANMLSEDMKRLEHDKSVIENEFKTFCESLAKFLSDPYFEVMPREDAIKDRIRELSASEREKRSQIDVLEAKVLELTNQLERQCELHQDSIRRARKAETSTFKQENRLQDLETELASGDMIGGSLRNEKAKFVSFVQRMSHALKMNDVISEFTYDYNTDVLIARAQQLARLESDAEADKLSSVYHLKRKVKALKEELKNKELHIDLLRRKVSDFDEKGRTRNTLELDRDDAVVTVQRLHRKVERLQDSLADERAKVSQLQTQLADRNQLKAVTFEQRRKIDELVDNVGKLSTTKERQRQKLSNLKRDLSTTEFSAEEHVTRLRSQLDAVTDDLKSTKLMLEEVKRKEQQLIDFREVIARMLGLNVTTLAIPDYEVISKLESLVRDHHAGAAASSALDRSLDAMDSRFRSGYEDGAYRPSSPARFHSPMPPHYSREYDNNHRRYHRRSRSVSPRRY